jgi:hypothetical protein
MWLGSCHVEPPFIVAGQIATAYYFAHFLIILPLFGFIDNILSLLGTYSNGLPLYKSLLIKKASASNFDKSDTPNKLDISDKSDKVNNKKKSEVEELEVLLDSIPSNPIATWN